MLHKYSKNSFNLFTLKVECLRVLHTHTKKIHTNEFAYWCELCIHHLQHPDRGNYTNLMLQRPLLVNCRGPSLTRAIPGLVMITRRKKTVLNDSFVSTVINMVF